MLEERLGCHSVSPHSRLCHVHVLAVFVTSQAESTNNVTVQRVGDLHFYQLTNVCLLCIFMLPNVISLLFGLSLGYVSYGALILLDSIITKGIWSVKIPLPAASTYVLKDFGNHQLSQAS